MKKFNKCIAIIEYVLFMVNGVWSVFSIMNGKIEIGVYQMFISLIAFTTAIYFTLEVKKDG